MRVLHLINRPQVRGAEMFAVRLAAQLESSDVQNAICSLYPASGEDERFDVGSLPMYQLDVKQTIFDRIFRVEPMAALRLRRVLKEFKPDLVVGHGTDTMKYASLSRLTHRNIRSVYMNIGLASFWASTRSRIWLNKFWLRNIDSSVSVSEHIRTDFIEHYGFDESRAVYIPNAVQAEGFDEASDQSVRQQMRAELGVDDESVVIGMVGRLSPEKGQDTLIRAAARLIGNGLPAKLVLIGDGPERERLENEAKAEGIQSSVHFLGVRNDVPKVLSGLDIFALASKSEGMPGVLIEAGFAGLPSIAYDVGGVTEVLTDESTGLVVPAEDFEALVNGLEGLARRDEWRAQIGERARAWCRSRFDMKIVADQYKRLFNQLLSGAELGNLDSAAVNADNQ